jgi:hypothetical protein
MRVPNAEESLGILVVPPCLKCQQPFEVRPLHISDVDHCVQYWSCASCGCVWATRDGEDLPSTRRRREIRNPHETSSLTAACDLRRCCPGQAGGRDVAHTTAHQQHAACAGPPSTRSAVQSVLYELPAVRPKARFRTADVQAELRLRQLPETMGHAAVCGITNRGGSIGR